MTGTESGPQAEPYASSQELLDEELRRIDFLVRAATLVWREQVASQKPERTWGMAHVSEEEVSRYLEGRFDRSVGLPESIAVRHSILIEQARALETRINHRIVVTESAEGLSLCRITLVLALAPIERDVLLVALLATLDARYRRLFGYLQDDASRSAASVELIEQILGPLVPDPGAIRRLLLSDGALCRHGLVSVEPEPGRPFHLRAVHIDESIVQHLIGAPAAPEELLRATRHPSASTDLDRLSIELETRELLHSAGEVWSESFERAEVAPVVVLHGEAGSERGKAAQALAGRLGASVFEIDGSEAPLERSAFQRFVELAFRESSLRRAVPVWSGLDERSEPWVQEILFAAVERHADPAILITEAPVAPSGRFQQRPLLQIGFPRPGYELRRDVWRERLVRLCGWTDDHVTEETSRSLANSFRLRVGEVDDVIASAWSAALMRDGADGRVTSSDLHDGCRQRSTTRFGGMAQRISPTTELGFDDLVLPPANRHQLDDLRQRIQHRHRVVHELGLERRIAMPRGLCVLFSGSSGTGKTMAARLLASEHKVDLYRIDLAAIVSKYVGETEKNLGRVFSEAESANAILFFDEADALFGKRGEIKEARDRWANLEVDYLLQRIEEFEGVVILATNLRQNIDAAFLRRMHSVVEFPAPDEVAREQIWLGLFPDSLARPTDEELARLARQFPLSGGSIKNVVVDAAFRAVADAGSRDPNVEMRHLGGALGRELQKLGRP